MEITEFMFCVLTGISVEVGGDLGSDYTKVAVKTFATNHKIKSKMINLAFSTKSREEIGSAYLNDDRKSQESMLERYGYKILESRERALNIFSNYLQKVLVGEWHVIDGEVLSSEDRGGFLGNFLLTDYSRGPLRYSDSTKFFVDALMVNSDRLDMISEFGCPMVFCCRCGGYKIYLKDPIRHCNDMVRNHEWHRYF